MKKFFTHAKNALGDTRGIGVKEIAIVVAVVVIIGVLVGFLSGWLPELISETVWPFIWENIQNLFNV